jgi:hypothetical protein
MKIKVYLPYFYEFGICILRHIRKINYIHSTDKTYDHIIVCCRKGEECLYPLATDFFYDWSDVDDIHKGKGDISKLYSPKQSKLHAYFFEKYKGHNIHIERCKLTEKNRELYAKSELNIGYYGNMYPNVDVLLGTRKRSIGVGKNFPHWQEVVDFFKSKGKTVGIIGKKETTFVPNNVDIVSHSIENTTQCIVGMMQNSKIIINTDSGLAHLCRLLRLKQVVISVKNRGGGPGQMPNFYDEEYTENLIEVSSKAFEKCDMLINSIKGYYDV